MKLIFDHNVDRRFRHHLPGHMVTTTKEMGWQTLLNGELLRNAAHAGFEAFISIDKKIEYEQNLKTLPLPIIVVDALSNALPSLIPFAPFVLELLTAPLDRLLYFVDSSGVVHHVSTPR